MIHILGLIVKIIGIILLALLGILLFVCCVVLFYPVSYRVAAKADGDIKSLSFEAKATWFLWLVSAFVIYREQKFEWQVTLFGWKLNSSRKKKKPAKHLDGVTQSDESSESTADDVLEQDVQEDTMHCEEKQQNEDNIHQKKSEQKEHKERQSWIEKIRCTIRKICDKIKAIWKLKNDIKGFLTNEVHLRAFGKVKKEFLVLIKHFRPRRLRGYARFGLKDPYNTGQVLAGLSVVYPLYGEHLDIYPEFEKEILEGNVYLKGHIRFVHFLRLIKLIFFDRDIKQTYKHFKKIDFHI